MTYFKDITLRNPIQLQAAANWNYSGQQYLGANTLSLRGGDYTRRGSFQLGDLFKYQTVLQSGVGTLAVSTPFTRTDFSTTYSAPTTLAYTTGLINSMDHYDGVLWILGRTTFGTLPFFAGLADGTSIPVGASASWVDKSFQTPFGANAGDAGFMRRTSDGQLYFLIERLFGPTSVGTMHSASTTAAMSSGFTYVTATAALGSMGGYGINSDGSIQMMSLLSGTTARSTDGGVHWANTMNFGTAVGGTMEFVHCPKFGSAHWCCTSLGGNGIWYTTDNGSSWTRSRFIGGSSSSTVGYNFTLLEKLDPNGEILLGFYGIAPLKIFMSLNGGKDWAFVNSVLPPYFDNLTHPEIAQEYAYGCILVNDGSRLSLYWPGITGDEGVFVSDLLNLPSYYVEPGDPRPWSP